MRCKLFVWELLIWVFLSSYQIHVLWNSLIIKHTKFASYTRKLTCVEKQKLYQTDVNYLSTYGPLVNSSCYGSKHLYVSSEKYITVQRQLGVRCPRIQVLYFWQPVLPEKCQKCFQYSSGFMSENILQHCNWSGGNSQEIENFFQILFGSRATHNWSKIHNFWWFWSTLGRVMMVIFHITSWKWLLESLTEISAYFYNISIEVIDST